MAQRAHVNRYVDWVSWELGSDAMPIETGDKYYGLVAQLVTPTNTMALAHVSLLYKVYSQMCHQCAPARQPDFGYFDIKMHHGTAAKRSSKRVREEEGM